MPDVLQCRVVQNEMIAHGICRIVFESSFIAQNAMPGQFVSIRCNDLYTPLLRRPISICDVDKKEQTVTIVFSLKSTGTQIISKIKPGETIDLIAPLGKGFDTAPSGNILVVGGGIGIFPLYFLLHQSKAANAYAVLGFRNKELVVMESAFKAYSRELTICTDDGSYGKKGLVSDGLAEQISAWKIDMIYACGPHPMLKSIAVLAQSLNLPCQISIEQRMGCGIGACLVCACKVSAPEGFVYKHVCKDGPVFWSSELILD